MKRVLARAAEDASAIGHRHIGAEHLLLGLLGETSCPAARILQKYGIDRERVWREVAQARPGVARAVTTGGEDTPGRDRLHALVNSLPHGALEHARNILQDLQTWPPQPPEEIARIRELMEQHMKQGLPPGARMDRGGGGSWSTDTKGEIQDGYFSATRVEDGAAVFETHRFHRGHEITVLERLRLSDDGKTLAYSLEIHGPKQEQRYAIDFVVS